MSQLPLAARLVLPFVTYIVIYFAISGHEKSSIYTYFFIASVIGIALVYVFQHQINFFWWKKYPPRLDHKLQGWLRNVSPYYASLSKEERQSFEDKVTLFMKDKTFLLKREKDEALEEDTQLIIAHEFVRLSQHTSDRLYKHYGQFVVYEHPFGSPQIQELHTAEMYYEDGVVIFSREYLINGFVDPAFVNIAMLMAASCFISEHPQLLYPDVSSMEKQDIIDNLGLNLEPFEKALGKDQIRKLSLLIYGYALHHRELKESMPRAYERLDSLFGIHSSVS